MITRKKIIIAGVAVVLLAGILWLSGGLLDVYAEAAESSPAIAAPVAVGPVMDPLDESSNYQGITALELKQKMDDESDDGYIILDIRDQSSYDQAHIPGAINIPLKELGYRLYSLDRTKDIIVYCNLGVTCKVACQILVNAGFKDVYYSVSGIQAWVYPIEATDGRVSI